MRLKNNKNIIIKEVDKGESVVTMSTKHYCKMVYDHLNYGLPKIHKSALISEAIAKQNNDCKSFRT